MTNEKDDDIGLLQKKIKVYSEKEIPVHITLKTESWLNGFIKEVKGDFFILEEFKNGKMPVFFQEIKYLETYTRVVK